MRSNEELMELFAAGDKSAGNELVENNMGLVYSVVSRFANRRCELEDLNQIGAIGLIKAVKKFNTAFGVKFSTYAVPMIAGEIKRFLRDDGVIKVSRSIKENAMKARRTEEILRKRLGRNPSIGEISKESGIDVSDIAEAFEATIIPESLQSMQVDETKKDSGLSLLDKISSEDTEERIVDKMYLKEMLGKLSEREYTIIVMRYFRDKTQSEIAKMIGVSQVQVSRIEKRALERIRENSKL